MPLYEAKLFIMGEAVNAFEAATFDRLQPVSGLIATRAASASVCDAAKAANAAAAAFLGWSRTNAARRSEILDLAADILIEREDQFVEVVGKEVGGTECWARFNCQLAADIFRQAAKLADFDTQSIRKGRDAKVTSYLMRQPVGVVLGIAPWNAPIALGCRAIAIPLACGNSVVLKASELCPKTHAMIIEVLNDAGIPPGVANLVTNSPETASEVVDALIAHNGVRRINFTGSTRVGRMVALSGARHLKPVVLELSGKAPLIILADGDIDAALDAVIFGAFFNQGQICISTERVIVDISIADEFVAKLAIRASELKAGDRTKGDYPIGSMIKRWCGNPGSRFSRRSRIPEGQKYWQGEPVKTPSCNPPSSTGLIHPCEYIARKVLARWQR